MNVHIVETQHGVMLVCHPPPAAPINMFNTYKFHIGYRKLISASFCIVNISDDPQVLRYVVIKSRLFGESHVQDVINANWATCRKEEIPPLVQDLEFLRHPTTVYVVDDPDELIMLRLKHG